MVEAIRYFTADYRDGRVYLGGKGKDAGYYAAQLLNEYDKDEFAARLAVFRTENWNTAKQLRTGFLDSDTYMKAGDEIRYILTLLPKLRPFSELDIQGERNRIESLFTEETAERLCEYFRQRALTANMDFGYIFAGHFPKEYDKKFCVESEKLLQTILETLNFYDRLGDDVADAAKKLRQFVKRTDEAERLDEEHLLPIAIEIFESAPFDVTTEYVPLKKSSRSKTATVARRLHFKSYYSFVLTDFFEGLQNGHYPRQCQMCHRYFVMTSARQTMYCGGWATELWRGKKITCRNLAAQQKRKELAANDPITVRYNSRCGAIRVEALRGTITKEFAAAAKALAKEHKQLAVSDPVYAAKQYAADMERGKLYTDTDKRMK